MSIIDLIGNTPMVELSKLNPNPNVKIYAKLEGSNPGGSVKDRAALSMIQAGQHSGRLDNNAHIVEATSGNTGIALAMIAAHYNIPITILMPETATEERKLAMKAYKANLILTDGEKGIEHSRHVAEKMASEDARFVWLNQFNNKNNPAAHYRTTGPEIWEDSSGHITHFVSAMGTTGTIVGTGRYLKEKNSKIKIIGAQPEEGSQIPGIRKWSSDMIPSICDMSYIDTINYVNQKEAIEAARRLAREEGILAGMSSGGACHIALNWAKEIDNGVIVFIVCDRGDRYLSSGLFE